MSQRVSFPAHLDEEPRHDAQRSFLGDLNLYKVLGVAALLLLTLALIEKRLGLVSFLPALFGLLGIFGQWRTAPALVLASLACTIPIRAAGFVPKSPSEMREFLNRLSHGGLDRVRGIEPVPDFLACAALVAFMGATFRLRAIEKHLFPSDPRKPAPSPPGATPKRSDKRPLHLVPDAEIVVFLAGLPVWCGLAALALFWLVRIAAALVLFPQFLREPLVFLWLAAFLLAILTAVLGYKRISEAEPQESLQFLQDQVWRELRRDQGRLNRWLTWGRLREQRRKENP